MSLVKVNLMSEMLALQPLKRLFAQRKQEDYQQATSQYSARLRQLYLASAERRNRLRRDAKLALESATFRFECSSRTPANELHGITIARASLPGAELGDQLALVEAVGEGSVLARGRVQSLTAGEIKIKLTEPLVLRPAQEVAQQASAHPEGEGEKDLNSGNQSGGEHEPGGQQDSGPSPKESAQTTDGLSVVVDEAAEVVRGGDEPVEELPKIERVIDFKIRFDCAGPASSRGRGPDEHYELVENVLARFRRLKCDPAIHKNLLGLYDDRSDLIHEKARAISLGEALPEPRGQQVLAIEQSLKRRVSLVEGPAGSGKTLVAAHIAGNASRLKRARVLVCSPLPANVDRLAQLIGKIDGVQVVKLPFDREYEAARRKNSSASGGGESDSSGYLLDKLVDDEIYLQAWNRSKETLRRHRDSMHAHAYRMVTSCSAYRRREVEAQVLQKADVVCCTNNQAASHLLARMNFDMLILDDVQITSELDCLVPIVLTRGVRQVTLLSDTRRRIRLARSFGRSQATTATLPNGVAGDTEHNQENSRPRENRLKRIDSSVSRSSLSNRNGSMQRRSYRKSKRAVASQETRSVHPVSAVSASEPDQEPGGLFERLLAIGLPTVDFRFQFRMHKTLSNFPNHHFYLGRLKNDPATSTKLQAEIESSLLSDESRFAWLPNRKYLTALFAFSAPSTSTASPSRVEVDPKSLIEKLHDIVGKICFTESIQESRLGIIFNRALDPELDLLKGLHPNIKRGTIREFIGQERDFIVLVALPDGDSKQLGVDYQTANCLSLCSEIPCDFKRDDSSLNCALTRARLGMFLITSITDGVGGADASRNGEPPIAPVSSSDEMKFCCGWNDVIKYYQESKLTVQQ